MTSDGKKPGLSDSGSLSASFRRFALRTTLVAGMMSAAGPTTTAQEDNQPAAAHVDKDEGGKPASPPLSMREKKRRARIRDTLLDNARGEFDALEANSETGYTRDLQNLGSRLTGNLKQEHSTTHNKVAFVDPEKLDVALSLGFAPGYAVSRLLSEQKIHIPDNEVIQAGRKATVGYENSKFSLMTYTQAATAMTNLTNPNPQACVVIPSSEHAVDADIKGLSRADIVDFTNRHESWHCMDSKYNLRHVDPEKMAEIRGSTLVAQANNRAAMEAYATLSRKETLADLGGAGDMIRAGKGLDLLDNVAAWRAGRAKEDPQHLSALPLLKLKEEIDKMGVDNFRKLSDADARKLYFKTTDDWGMTAKSLQTAIRFDSAKQPERQAFLDKAKTDVEVAKGLVTYHYMRTAKGEQPSGALDGVDAAQLKAYDADKLLDDKAFEIGKKITPQTIIKAYNRMQEDLHEKMKAEPGNQLYPLQATKLQQAFLTHARELDYVGANAARGVDITRAEPALKAFSESPKKNPAAAAPVSG